MKRIIIKLKESTFEDWCPLAVCVTFALLALIGTHFLASASAFTMLKNVSVYILGFGIGITLNKIFTKKEKK